MRKLIITIMLIFIFTTYGNANSIFDHEPSQTLFRSSVANLTIVDSFLVSCSDNEIALFKFDNDLKLFTYLYSVPTTFVPVSAERYDSLLIIKDVSNDLVFADISDPLQIQILGQVSFDDEFSDFVLQGNDLYLSMYFEGVWKYTLSDYNTAAFVDSSMLGILVTELYEEDDTLYVLDEYNGILRYDINSPAFGNFIDFLYIPKRASAFTRFDSLFVATLTNSYLYFLNFDPMFEDPIVDSLMLYDIPGKVLVSDSLLIAIAPRDLYFYDKSTMQLVGYDKIENTTAQGTLFKTDSSEFLLLPIDGGGLDIYDLHQDSIPSSNGLSYSSGVSDLQLTDSTLFIGGYREPIKVIDARDTTNYEISYQILDYLSGTAKFDLHGDSLFVLAPEFNQFLFVMNADSPDSNFVLNNYQYDGYIFDIHYNPTTINKYNLLFLQGLNFVKVFLVGDSGNFYDRGQWNFVSNILDMAITDSTLLIATTKKEVFVYNINQYFNLKFKTTISVTSDIKKLLIANDNLLIFEENKVFSYYLSPIYGPLIENSYDLNFPVTDAYYYNDYIFTVGREGVAAYTFFENELLYSDNGGLAGDIITANRNLIVTSDNNGINTYSLSLIYPSPADTNGSENSEDVYNNNDTTSIYDLSGNSFQSEMTAYPNPFNLTTNFSFSIPSDDFVRLEIYNLLGQKIKTLVNGHKTMGSYSVEWNGKNDFGEEVATGIYLYRFESSEENVKGKVVLLK